MLLRQPNSFKITTASSSLLQVGTLQQQGKMNFHIILAISLTLIWDMLTTNIMPELKKNVLNFRYRANCKYEGMLAHSFDRFYVVTRFEMPKIEDLKLTTCTFDLACSHLVADCCIIFYQLTGIWVRSLLNTIVKVWVIFMIFMSNQHLCLYPNELKFEPTTCQLIGHLMNLSDVLSCSAN